MREGKIFSNLRDMLMYSATRLRQRPEIPYIDRPGFVSVSVSLANTIATEMDELVIRMQTTRDLVRLLHSIDPTKPISSLSLPVPLDDQAEFDKRMEIINSSSNLGTDSTDLAEIEQQARQMITRSTAFIESIFQLSAPSLGWFNVPDPIFTFTGRFDALSDLSKSLMAQSQIMTITHPLVVGMGGIGITELAILFAHHARSFFHDHIRLIHAENEPAMARSFRDFADALGLVIEPKHTTEMVVNMVYGHISRFDQCLLILDSAIDLDSIRPYHRPRFVQGNKNHRLLITSRSQDWDRLRTFCGITAMREKIELQLWNKIEAVAYVLNRLGEVSAKDADLIVAKFGYLPLDIAQAAAYMETEKMSIDRYMEIFDELLLAENSPVDVSEDVDPAYRNLTEDSEPNQQSKTVASIFLLTRNTLAAQHRKRVVYGDTSAGDALVIVHMMSLIGSKDIPDHVFEGLFEENAKIRTGLALNRLVQYSLIQRPRSRNPDVQYYSIHGLIQIVIKRLLILPKKERTEKPPSTVQSLPSNWLPSHPQ